MANLEAMEKLKEFITWYFDFIQSRKLKKFLIWYIVILLGTIFVSGIVIYLSLSAYMSALP
jgi:cytochrome b subunit of formate dehydrogenase